MSIIMQYGSGSGKATARKTALLWENSSPASSFAAKTVNLSDSVSNYDFLYVTYMFSKTYQYLNSRTYLVSDLVAGATADLQVNGWTANRTGTRHFTVPTTTSVAFSKASYNTADNNEYAIPAAIYGIKL